MVRRAAILAIVLGLLGSTSARADGSLTVTGAAPGSFAVTLNGSDQSAYSSLSDYTATDTLANGKGWNVTFQATPFSCSSGVGRCPSAGDAFPSGSLLMAPPSVACVGTTCQEAPALPTVSLHAIAAIDVSSPIKVVSAAAKTGKGTFSFTPGAVGPGQLELIVPSYAYATTYSSTLTVSIGSGP